MEQQKIANKIANILIILTGALLILVMTSCSKTVYVPIKETHTEFRDVHHRDSIHVLDSIYMREKGDTVFLTRWRTEYRDRLIRDSIVIQDSIPIPYPVEVDKMLSWWQKTRIYLGNITILVLFCWLFYLGIRNRLRK